jgi:hypothetical protein
VHINLVAFTIYPMNPVEYTILVQKIILATGSLSLIYLLFLLMNVDPTSTNWAIQFFLFGLTVFLTCSFSLITFWWTFSIKKMILPIDKVNSIIYQSFTLTCCLVFLLVLNNTNQLNIATFAIVLISLIFYGIWINSRS